MTGTAGDLQDDRNEERADGDVVHEGGEKTGRDHQEEGEPTRALSGQPQDVVADEVRDARSVQAAAEHQNRGDRDDGRVAEPLDGLQPRNQPRQGEQQQDDERDEVVAYPTGDEEHDGRRHDRQDQQDGGCHGIAEAGSGVEVYASGPKGTGTAP